MATSEINFMNESNKPDINIPYEFHWLNPFYFEDPSFYEDQEEQTTIDNINLKAFISDMERIFKSIGYTKSDCITTLNELANYYFYSFLKQYLAKFVDSRPNFDIYSLIYDFYLDFRDSSYIHEKIGWREHSRLASSIWEYVKKFKIINKVQKYRKKKQEQMKNKFTSDKISFKKFLMNQNYQNKKIIKQNGNKCIKPFICQHKNRKIKYLRRAITK